jgi:hypothetical protein
MKGTTIVDLPYPSYLYRNPIASNIAFVYSQLTQYIPRVLTKLSKYSVIKWLLIQLHMNYGWLLMLLVAVL